MVISGSGNTRTVTLSGFSGAGTVGITVAAGTASDLAGNLAPASAASGSFTVDVIAPSISIGPPSVTITNSGLVTFPVSYADVNFANSTLSAGNITLNTTGTASASSVSISGSGSSRTVTLSGIAGDGTVGISIAAGTAIDSAGNLADAAGPSSSVVVDTTPPAVLIGAPSVTVTNGGAISFPVTYSDLHFATSTLASTNVIVNKTGSANQTNVTIAGGGTNWIVTLSGITGDGTLGISIAAGTAIDTAGNAAPATGPGETTIIDSHAPTPTIIWATPAAISYGTALGASQLNASANTPGTFVYTPDLGTVLPPGTNTLQVAFQPDYTAGYNNTVATVGLIVQNWIKLSRFQPHRQPPMAEVRLP